jgi:hypothetical protein
MGDNPPVTTTEPEKSTNRNAPLMFVGLLNGLLFAFCGLILAVSMGFAVIGEYRAVNALQDHGVDTTSEVTEITRYSPQGIANEADVRFTTESGSTEIQRLSLIDTTSMGAKVGAQVPIVYDATDPSIVRHKELATAQGIQSMSISVGIGVLLVAFGIWLAAISRRALARNT